MTTARKVREPVDDGLVDIEPGVSGSAISELTAEDLVAIDAEMDRSLGIITKTTALPNGGIVVTPENTEAITPEVFDRLKEVFADMVKEAEPVAPEPKGRDMRPGKDKMMSLSGGLYLPVRRRVAWMRGEPSPQPDWSIVNTLLKYEMGELESPKGGGPGGRMPKIKGGYAVVKSEVLNERGQIISTGYAQERSEVFPDFIEKAETAAVGRAMALAGYGTEAALDLDEGLDDGNVVDAPVRPIVISDSGVEGVKVGGRAPGITNAQVKEIQRRVKAMALEPEDVADVIKRVTGVLVPDEVLSDPEAAGPFLMSVIRGFTNDQAKDVIAAIDDGDGDVT